MSAKGVAPWLRTFLEQIYREDRFFLLLSVFIGVFSGLALVCFHYAIDLFRLLFLGAEATPPIWRMLLAPAGGGLLIAFLALRYFPAARGNGVNQTKGALYIFNGYMPFRTAIGKFWLCSMSIGAGFSLGPEDPSLQIGACLASLFGRWMRLTRDRMRLIAPVGAAAGLAGAFNAPISAVLFVIEEVVGRWTAGILGSVVLSAVSSVVVVRWFLGSEPLFRIPVVAMRRPSELAAYLALGLIGGLLSVLFASGVSSLRPRCRRLPLWSQYLQPAVAGLLVGLIGVLGAPQVMGAGYEAMDAAMHGRFTWRFLLVLAVVKIVATLLSFLSATPGGMFAPTLFIGAMLGASVGGLQAELFPQLAWSPGTYALVGMGVLFAGFLRAPMTSVFMILEVSGDYSIIVPVICANTVSYLVARTLQPTPLFDILSRQDGLALPSMEEEREVSILRVEDALRAPEGAVYDRDMSVREALGRLRRDPWPAVLVLSSGDRWRSLRREELEALVASGEGERSLELSLPGEETPVLYGDQPLAWALRSIDRWPLLPVVSRANSRRLDGVITQEAVLERFRRYGEP